MKWVDLSPPLYGEVNKHYLKYRDPDNTYVSIDRAEFVRIV